MIMLIWVHWKQIVFIFKGIKAIIFRISQIIALLNLEVKSEMCDKFSCLSKTMIRIPYL